MIRTDSGKYRVAFSLKGVPLVNKFVGRDDEMQQLEYNFLTSLSRRRKVFTVYGMGGIGKTQLAVEFARKYNTRYSAIFWLNGSSKDQLRQSFADVACRLPPDQLAADTAEALQQSQIDVDAIVKEVLRWLAL